MAFCKSMPCGLSAETLARLLLMARHDHGPLTVALVAVFHRGKRSPHRRVLKLLGKHSSLLDRLCLQQRPEVLEDMGELSPGTKIGNLTGCCLKLASHQSGMQAKDPCLEFCCSPLVSRGLLDHEHTSHTSRSPRACKQHSHILKDLTRKLTNPLGPWCLLQWVTFQHVAMSRRRRSCWKCCR